MGNKTAVTYFEEGPDQGYCFVSYNDDKSVWQIEYFDKDENKYHTEEFPGKSQHYVEDAGENWALGIKKLDIK